MVLQELEDRLYTSTEVANILGVSLRSVYRYLEDGKLDAEMKTATGRHRFTKQNILDFLSPQNRTMAGAKTVESTVAQAAAPAAEPLRAPRQTVVETQPEPVAEVEELAAEEVAEGQEDVDWLAKFRQAAERYKAEQVEPAPAEAPAEPVAAPTETLRGLTYIEEEIVAEPITQPAQTSQNYYYKSGVGGLKDIAQNIDKSAKKASLEYAFTMDAGLSLHKPIRPFSLIHAYVRSEDLAFFEKILGLQATDIGEAQLCLIVSDDPSLFADKKEMHGLSVVDNTRLRADLIAGGKEDLANEL